MSLRRDDDPHDRYGSDTVRLAFGRNASGRVVHVSEVPSGVACGCTCPACGGTLVAHKGPKNAYHMKHATAAPGAAPCGGGQMTALHAYARDLVAERRLLTVPAVEAGGRVAMREREVSFDAARTECQVLGFVADVLAWKSDRTLCVEIRVTHASTQGKIEAMRAAGQAMVEIDLSDLRGSLAKAELDRLILHDAPRHWLSNVHLERLEAELRAEEEERLRHARELAEARSREADARLRLLLDAAAGRALADGKPDDRVDLLTGGGLRSAIVDLPCSEPGFFAVRPERWRALALAWLPSDRDDATYPWDFACLARREEMADRKVAEAFERAGASAGSTLAVRSTEDCLTEYLKLLRVMGLASEENGLWWATPELVEALAAAKVERERSERAAQQAAEVAGRVAALNRGVRTVLDAAPDELRDALDGALRAWLADGPDGDRRVMERRTKAGGAEWLAVRDGLSALARGLCRHGDPIPDTLGIGVVGPFMAEGRRAHAAALEEAAREAAEAREKTLRGTASAFLAEEAAAWLSTPMAPGGLAPAAAARKSEGGLREAMGHLEVLVDARVRHQANREEVWKRAASIEPDPYRRKMLVTCVHPDVPGRQSLNDHCRDDVGLRLCIKILENAERRPQRGFGRR